MITEKYILVRAFPTPNSSLESVVCEEATNPPAAELALASDDLHKLKQSKLQNLMSSNGINSANYETCQKNIITVTPNILEYRNSHGIELQPVLYIRNARAKWMATKCLLRFESVSRTSREEKQLILSNILLKTTKTDVKRIDTRSKNNS